MSLSVVADADVKWEACLATNTRKGHWDKNTYRARRHRQDALVYAHAVTEKEKVRRVRSGRQWAI